MRVLPSSLTPPTTDRNSLDPQPHSPSNPRFAQPKPPPNPNPPPHGSPSLRRSCHLVKQRGGINLSPCCRGFDLWNFLPRYIGIFRRTFGATWCSSYIRCALLCCVQYYEELKNLYDLFLACCNLINFCTFVKMGIYLSTPKTEKLSEDGRNDKLKFGLSSMQGWRATMEDAHSAFLDLDNNTSFFGVFDGHGGRVVAKFCAKYLHKEVLRSEAYTAGDLGTAVHRAFFRMDEMMRGQRGWRELQALGDKINQFTGMIEGLIWSPRGSDSNDEHDDWAFEEGPHSDFTGPTCGCTACVAIVRNNQLVVANAGDSRCVISRNGQAYNLSRDHKPELEAERERILKAGGYIQMGRVNGTINLSRAIGDMEYKQNKFLSPDKQIVTANPDINIVELCDDDEFLVLACDGIWDCMSSQHLVDFIHEHINTESSLSAVCERVLDRCLAPSTLGGEGCDNMTMILVQFKKPINQNKNASSGEQSSVDTQLSETNAAEENGS